MVIHSVQCGLRKSLRYKNISTNSGMKTVAFKKNNKSKAEVRDANQDENQSQEIILLQLLIFCLVLIGLLLVQKH